MVYMAKIVLFFYVYSKDGIHGKDGVFFVLFCFCFCFVLFFLIYEIFDVELVKVFKNLKMSV